MHLLIDTTAASPIDRGVNSSSPGQNGRHFPDDIFACIFLKENVWTSIKILLKFIPNGPINNIPALVQITRRQAINLINNGYFTDTCMRHSASMKNTFFVAL